MAPATSGGRSYLAELLVGRGEDDQVGDCLVPLQHVLNRKGRDLLTAAIDDLLEAADELQVAVRVDLTIITSAQPRPLGVVPGPGRRGLGRVREERVPVRQR